MREPDTSQAILAELQDAGVFDLLDAGAPFTTATDEAIERAFDDAIAFAGLAEAFEAIQSLAGDDVAGLGSITELGRAREAIDLVMVVRGLLLLRPLTDEGAIEASLRPPRSGATTASRAGTSRALPHLLPLLGPAWRRAARALPAGERDRVTGEVRAYLDARPELVAMFEDG